jgi:4-diphosphocytidyl-2-C-methyl-D-erythritol kinase
VTPLVARAPGKVNLCLFLGPVREDGRHELATLYESVSVADEISVEVAERDEVICPGVDGPNLVERALAGLRESGWEGPPVRVLIRKRVPVAGGMGGGSSDAAAVLRMAAALAPVSRASMRELAASLGSDVPGQLVPGVSIGTGAGELIERVARPLPAHAFVIVPQDFGLSTAEVYREADRLGLPRAGDELAALQGELRAVVHELSRELLVNDLEPAALSLAPQIEEALEAVNDTGAAHAMISGSGPTVLGVFFGPEAGALAADAADALAERYPGATAGTPVSEEFGAPRGS